MYKCLTVVALALLVLTGAMGLRNITAANAAMVPASSLSAPVFLATAIGPAPPIPRGGGHVAATAIGPAPPIPRGGGHVVETAIGPAPPIPRGGGK
jgi:hypothetical protein